MALRVAASTYDKVSNQTVQIITGMVSIDLVANEPLKIFEAKHSKYRGIVWQMDSEDHPRHKRMDV